MLSSCFFLVLALSSAKSETININAGSERILSMMNFMIRSSGEMTTKIPAGSIPYGNGTITYSEGTLIGLDSMVRTGDCLMTKDASSTSFDIHMGYSLMAAFFDKVKYNDELMSAFFRIRDNSLRITFTVNQGANCHVSLGAIDYERMSKVVLGSSIQELDGLDVDDFFQTTVMPVMDKILNVDKTSIENSLQFLCQMMPGNESF